MTLFTGFISMLSRACLTLWPALIAALFVGGVSSARAEVFTADQVYGDSAAPVTVVEYASLGCSHCKNFHEQIWPAYKEKYVDTGQVRHIFRVFPLHLPDLQAETLARCGGAARYGAFIDLLFANQSEWTRGGDPMPVFQSLARQGGISAEAFDACLTDEALQHSILERRTQAMEAGVNATPSFQVGGQVYSGVQSMEDWAAILGDGTATGSQNATDQTWLYASIAAAVAILGGGAFVLTRRKSG